MYAGEGLPTPAQVPRLSFPVLSHTGSHVKSHISRRRPAIPHMTQQSHPIPSRFLWISIWSHHCKTFQLPVPFPSQVKRKRSHSHFFKWERQQRTMISHPPHKYGTQNFRACGERNPPIPLAWGRRPHASSCQKRNRVTQIEGEKEKV